MRARPQRPLGAIEAIVPKLIAAVYDEWPDLGISGSTAAWDSYERASDRLSRKIRNAHAAFLADVINYALFCAVARVLQTSNKVAAKDIVHTKLLAELERYTREASSQPEIDAIVRHIERVGENGALSPKHGERGAAAAHKLPLHRL